MKQNVGSNDKAVRVVIGLIIFGAGMYYQSWLGLLGIIPIFTAIAGWCPLYSVLGLCTTKECRKESAQV